MSKYIIPERIYPWLSIFSGLVIAVMAGYLFLHAWTRSDDSASNAGVLHSHWYSRRSKQKKVEDSSPEANTSAKDGPLAATACARNHRRHHSLPCGAGCPIERRLNASYRAGPVPDRGVQSGRGRGVDRHRHRNGPRQTSPLALEERCAVGPAVATNGILSGDAAGRLAIAGTAMPATGLSFHLASLTSNHLPSFAAIIGLGLFLGIRHSTDPDHVVAGVNDRDP